MKVQAVQDNPVTSYSQVVAQSEGKSFWQVFEGLQKVTEQFATEYNSETDKLFFRDMINIEDKAVAAFRQGDLISYERYMKELSAHKGALERINTAAAAIATKASVQNGLFPNDAPAAVQSYMSGLSMKERMVMFTQVAVQDIIANAYKGSDGNWHSRRAGEPGYVNLFERPDFSYDKLITDMLAHIELNRKYLSYDDYEEQLDVILGLKKALEEQ